MVTELPLTTKPCEVCGVLVEDVDDPDFKEAWLCYWCHSQKEGKNTKAVFNSMGQMLKELNRAAARHNPRPVSPERVADARARMKKVDPVTALENIMEALEPVADPDCVEAAGKAWDAWEAERNPYKKVLLQMELALHVAGLMEHAEALSRELPEPNPQRNPKTG